MQDFGSLAGCGGLLKINYNGPIFGSSKFWSNLNGRFGDPMRGMTPQILTRLPIDLKIGAN